MKHFKHFNNSRINLSRRLTACFLAGSLLAGSFAMAQESAPAVPNTPTQDGLAVRYPSGSIQSEDTANRALVEIDQQRKLLDQKYGGEERECYAKFFATSCVDAAKERRRVAMAQIRKVEVEANAFLRGNRVVQRDKKLAEKRANDAANPPKPLADLPVKQAMQSAADKEKENQQHIADTEAKRTQRKQDEINDAPKHAQSAVAYQKKVADAQARQRDVAAKKAEKARQAAAKTAAASAASKPPQDSAPNSNAAPTPAATNSAPAVKP